MNSIENVIDALQNLRYLAPASDMEILEAEKRLGIAFADEYKDYVKKYGVISAKGIELTGVTSTPRLNVADVTMAEKELNWRALITVCDAFALRPLLYCLLPVGGRVLKVILDQRERY